MFGFSNPGYTKLRSALPASLQNTYDQVFDAIEHFVPSYWDTPVRDRTLTLVMAEWMVAVAEEGRLPVPRYAYLRAAHMAEITRKFNNRDPKDGWSSSSRANEIIAALHDDGLIPPE